MGCTQANVVRTPSGWSDVLELPNVKGDFQVSEEAEGGRLHGAIYCPASGYAVVLQSSLQGAECGKCEQGPDRDRLELHREVQNIQRELPSIALGSLEAVSGGERQSSIAEGKAEDSRDCADSGGLADDGGVPSDTPATDDTEGIFADWRRASARAKADRDLENHSQGCEGCAEDERSPSAWKGREGACHSITGRLLRDLEKLSNVARPRQGGRADTQDEEELFRDVAPSVLRKARAKVCLPHDETEFRKESLVARSANRDYLRAARAFLHGHDPQVSWYRPVGHETSLSTLQNGRDLYVSGEPREVGGLEGIVAHSEYWELPIAYRLALERYREQLEQLIDFSDSGSDGFDR